MTPTPHASGALWIPESRTILIADAHLGYGWAQRRRGELGPVRDLQSREKLAALLEELSPQEVVFLGDLVHAPRPADQERAFIEETLRYIAKLAPITIVRGNHDRAFARDFPNLGLTIIEEWRAGNLVAIHGDRPYIAQPNETVIAGHLHPSLSIEDAAGVKLRVRVFLIGDGLIILPAFSPFAAGLDLSRGLSPKLQQLLKNRKIQAVAATGKRTLLLGPLERFAGASPTQRYDPTLRRRKPY